MKQRRLGKGDYVRLRDCSVKTRGVIIDEFSREYVSVQWDDLPAPATYRRSSLEPEPSAADSRATRVVGQHRPAKAEA